MQPDSAKTCCVRRPCAARVGEQTARSLFTPTLVTMLVLPGHIDPGHFGMNAGGIALVGLLGAVVFRAITTVAAWQMLRRRARSHAAAFCRGGAGVRPACS